MPFLHPTSIDASSQLQSSYNQIKLEDNLWTDSVQHKTELLLSKSGLTRK